MKDLSYELEIQDLGIYAWTEKLVKFRIDSIFGFTWNVIFLNFANGIGISREEKKGKKNNKFWYV